MQSSDHDFTLYIIVLWTDWRHVCLLLLEQQINVEVVQQLLFFPRRTFQKILFWHQFRNFNKGNTRWYDNECILHQSILTMLKVQNVFSLSILVSYKITRQKWMKNMIFWYRYIHKTWNAILLRNRMIPLSDKKIPTHPSKNYNHIRQKKF